MLNFKRITASSVFAILVSTHGYAAWNDLDTSFNTIGAIDTKFNSSTKSRVLDLEATHDGKLYSIGSNLRAGTTSDWEAQINRYNADGTLDTSFDADGMLTLQYGKSLYATAAVLQADGKLLVLAQEKNSNNQLQIAVLRLMPNGKLDTTFATQGIYRESANTHGHYPYDIALTDDGNIYFTYRYDEPTSFYPKRISRLRKLTKDGSPLLFTNNSKSFVYSYIPSFGTLEQNIWHSIIFDTTAADGLYLVGYGHRRQFRESAALSHITESNFGSTNSNNGHQKQLDYQRRAYASGSDRTTWDRLHAGVKRDNGDFVAVGCNANLINGAYNDIRPYFSQFASATYNAAAINVGAGASPYSQIDANQDCLFDVIDHPQLGLVAIGGAVGSTNTRSNFFARTPDTYATYSETPVTGRRELVTMELMPNGKFAVAGYDNATNNAYIAMFEGQSITPANVQGIADFSLQVNMALSSTAVSNLQTANNATAVNIKAFEGQLSTDSGINYANAALLGAGGNIRMRHTNSAIRGTTKRSILVVDGGSYIKPNNRTWQIDDGLAKFETTTEAKRTPAVFNFTAITNQALSTVVDSSSVTVSGLPSSTSAQISIVGGEYSVNNAAWTDVLDNVSNGDTVQVRHTTSAGFSSDTTTTLSVGSVSADFTSTTRAANPNPDPFIFEICGRGDVSNLNNVSSSTEFCSIATVSGHEVSAPISISGGIKNYRVLTTGNTLCSFGYSGGALTGASTVPAGTHLVYICMDSAAAYNTAKTGVLTVGTTSATWNITTQLNAPAQFTFTDVTNASISTSQVSNEVTLSGIPSSPAAISITGGEYSINNGVFTTSSGTVSNGDTVKVRHTSSSNFSTQVDTVLDIGGVFDTFSSTTQAQDSVPDSFSFTDVSNVTVGTSVTSNAILVQGINSSAAITITGGEYSIQRAPVNIAGNLILSSPLAFTSNTGTVFNGDSVRVRHTSSSNFSTQVDTVLTIGGVSGTFSSTTEAQDTVPDSIVITALSNQEPNTMIESTEVIISGINSAAAISITNGDYSINNGAYTSNSGTVNNGDSIKVRHTTSASFSDSVTTDLTVGTVQSSFTSTTKADPATQSQPAKKKSSGGGSVGLLSLVLLSLLGFMRRKRY